ncbi:E3 ubiquitin-protein [Salix suchowensis]|nr:E3 ubiquitin-protein [Salix suchowensis]
MGDAVLLVDDLQTSSAIPYCRICHEAEFESFKSLEAPCACSGTVKFAHRDCIQRWCNEKGNTNCEICLQNYEPGYTAVAPSKKCELIQAVTIRDSMEISRTELDLENQEIEEATSGRATADTKSSGFRYLAITITALMLSRHLFAAITVGTEYYPFTLATILVLRACGILFPLYVVFRTFAAIHESIRCQYLGSDDDDEYDHNSNEDQDEHQHLV